MDILQTLQQNPALYFFWVAILSLLIGSFLNVVIYRIPIMMERETRQYCHSFLGQNDEINHKPFNLFLPLSRCNHCGNTLKPWHNIPVFSYLFLHGKCAYCKTAISIRYPLVELLCCVMSTYVAYHFGFSWQALAAMLFTWLLISLTFIDLDHQLLPDNLTFSLLWAGLFISIFSLFVFTHTAIIGAIAGYGIFWLFANVFKWATGKDGLGQGDFKLLSALGAWLGWQMLPVTVLLSALLGCVYALLWTLVKRESIRGKPIPFGPFLAIAGWISLLWGPQILFWYLGFINGGA